MSAEHTEKAKSIIKKFGGEPISMYALLGEYDLVLIANFSGIEETMKAAVALSKLTCISFSSLPAVKVKEFDRMIAEA